MAKKKGKKRKDQAVDQSLIEEVSVSKEVYTNDDSMIETLTPDPKKKDKKYVCVGNFSHDTLRFRIGNECNEDQALMDEWLSKGFIKEV